MKQSIKQILSGIVIGIANIIPGVSGGTLALILGIYERLIKILNKFNIETIKLFYRIIKDLVKNKFSKKSLNALLSFIKDIDLIFLIEILIGAGIAIVSLSSLMKYLLINYYEYTYSFFFGLILISIIIPFRLIKKIKIKEILFMILGIGLTLYVAINVNQYDKIKKKSNLHKTIYLQNMKNVDLKNKKINKVNKLFQKYNIYDYIVIFISGIIAISAMALPGISGSFVLILLGQYLKIITAISNIFKFNIDDIILLGIFGLGMIIGILIFSRLIEFALKKFKNITISFLIGLIIGSLYALWPFKKFIIMDKYVLKSSVIEIVKNYKVYTNINIMPNSLNLTILSIIFLIAGILIMIPFIKISKEN